MSKLEALFGLPQKVNFCKTCCYSNQRPSSVQEFRHSVQSKKVTLDFDKRGICDACNHAEKKKTINWIEREAQLIDLLNKYRKNDGSYDCVVPGSGGKDSVYASHILKYKYGMNPLTVTWPPILYTDYGLTNFRNWLSIGGFDNITFNQNGKVMKVLTKLSIENLFHPFQTFILGQKQLAPKLAHHFNIPLVFYGEHEAEFGNPIAEASKSTRGNEYHTIDDLKSALLGGLAVEEIMDTYNFTLNDLSPFLPLESHIYEKSNIEVQYLGYYLPWQPQESYYYSVQHSGFQARPFRTQGTYSKYLSLDDKIDDLNYYCYFIKFGFGRCTEDASQEIRNGHITREEGQALVARYDGEFPNIYYDDIMNYLGIDSNYFKTTLTDKFRSPHLWASTTDGWKLRHTVNGDGVDD